MQLDQTRIVIRERSLPDLLDLSLQVLRAYAGHLLLCSAVLVLPLMLLNWLLIGWMAWEEYDWLSVWRYQWAMMQLVYVEAPLASLLVTLYLGEVMFCQQPTAAGLVRAAVQLLPRVFLGQILLRGVLLAWLLVAGIPRDSVWSPAEGLLLFLCLVVLLVRAIRPFLNEIILLERSPYRAADRRTVTISARSGNLHGPHTADLFGRWLATAPVAVLLTCSLVATCWFVVGTFSNDWRLGPLMVHLVMPMCMWLVASYMAVARFLSYLDLRIRREGWEVELKMRAEAARMSSHPA